MKEAINPKMPSSVDDLAQSSLAQSAANRGTQQKQWSLIPKLMKHLLFLLCVLSVSYISLPAQGAPTRKEIELQIDGKKKSITAVKKRIQTRTVRIKMHKACRDLHPEYYSGCDYYYSKEKLKVVIGGGAVCDGHIHKIREYDPVSGRPMTVSHGCPWRTGGKLQDGIHQAISKLELDNEADSNRISMWERQIAELTEKLQEGGK